MNEFDELKKKLSEIWVILGRIIRSACNDILNWMRGGRQVKLTNRAIGVLAIGCVVLGVGVSSVLTGRRSSGRVDSGRPATGSDISLLRYFFAKEFPVPGLKEDKSFVISDFEQPEDLKVWKLQSAKLTVAEGHSSEGTKAAEILFFSGEEMSGIQVDDYFESRKGLRDWTDYGYFAFDLFNVQADTERIILQIKDRSGARFKQDLHIPGKKNKSFKIPLSKVGSRINLRQIEQFTFFVWKPKIDKIFHIDYVRLLPKGQESEAQRKEGVDAFENAPQPKSRPVNMWDYGFGLQKAKWRTIDPYTQKPMVRVPFIVRDEARVARVAWPAQGGMPFPRGELTDETHIRIRNAAWEDYPFQTRVLARWPDKSIRWLQIDLESQHEGPLVGRGYFLDYGPDVERQKFSSPLRVEETGDRIRVETGPLAFSVSKKAFYLFDDVSLDINKDGVFTEDEKVASQASISLSFKGEEYFGQLDRSTYKVEIEEQGSEKIGLKAGGWFQAKDGKRYCKWIVRIHAFKEKSYVRVYHTFIFTGYPENRYYGVYKDLNLPENETIEQMTMTIPLTLSGEARQLTFGTEASMPSTTTAAAAAPSASVQEGPSTSFSNPRNVSLFQKDYETSLFTIEETETAGAEKATGWFDYSDGRSGLAVAVRDFRENYPKEMAVRGADGQMTLHLWPSRAGALDLRTTADAFGPGAVARGSAFGLAKTHEILFYFHEGGALDAQAANIARAFNEPLMVRVNPYWADRSGALGRLYPADSRYARQEKGLEKLFDWAARHPKNFKWYGMLDFGDTLSWYRNEDEERWYGDYGWHPVGRWGWYNNEAVGLHSGALIQYVRTGMWKYFQFGEDSARHIMDVDTVHYNTIASDPRLNVLDDEFSKVGSMHRHNGNHWGGRNEEASHTNVYGILLYYYLTGYERAFDVANEVGSFFLTNPITFTNHPDISPHRSMANVLWGDVLLYQATWDERYKKAADQIIEVYLKGQNADGSFNETYDPVSNSWSGKKHVLYMTYYTVPAFIAYHELTQDPDVLEALGKLVRFISGTSRDAAPGALNGMAYLYLTTRDPAYIKMAEKHLHYILGKQEFSNDPMTDGLIFKKPVYHRTNFYLYSIPWIFAALEESFEVPRS